MSKVLHIILTAAIITAVAAISPLAAFSKSSTSKAKDDPGCQAAVADAAALFAQGKSWESAELLRKWRLRCPSNCQLHLMLSTVLLHLGNSTAEALSEAAQAVSADDKSVAAHLQYGLVLLGSKKSWQAAQQFEKVIELDADNYEAWSSLANVYASLHEDSKATAAAQKAAALEPNSRTVQKRVSDNLEQSKRQSDPKELQQIIDGQEPSP